MLYFRSLEKARQASHQGTKNKMTNNISKYRCLHLRAALVARLMNSPSLESDNFM